MSPKIFILSLLAIVVCNIPGRLSQQEGFKYIGCFKDKKARGLEKNLGKLGKVSDCVDKCRGLKLNYAGLQYGGYCFCGNKHDKYGKASKCNRKCRSGEICGGSWANSVYKVLGLPLKKEHIGCFKIMIIGQWAGNVVSVEHCLKKCQRFGLPYAGVAYGIYCSCGKDISKFRKGSTCTMKCLSKEENCGGQSISSVYKTPKLEDGYIQKGHIGCYKENTGKKVMSSSGSAVTGSAVCTDKCRMSGMKYAAIRDGQHCHCVNKYDTLVKATDCTKKCDTGEPCGGTSSYSVYEVLEPLQRAVPIGCYEEETPKKLPKFASMISALSQCFEKCLNYKYFGILNASKCYCGNDYPKAVKSDKCTKECTFGGICGGVNAYSVFKVQLDN